MKILHVITDIDAGGGAETCLCRLVSAMSQSHYCHTVAVLQGESGLSAHLRSLNVEVEHLGMGTGGNAPVPFLKLRRLIRAKRPDIVHGWMRRGNLAAALAGAGGAPPLVWSIHNSLGEYLKSGMWKAWLSTVGLKQMAKRPNAIVYVSSRSAAEHAAIGFPEGKARVIPNAWDTEAFKPNAAVRARLREALEVSEENILIGHVARWHPAKDHENFVAAAAEFIQQVPNAIFCMVGNGITENNEELYGMICRFGLKRHVRMCGLRSDVGELIAAFDISTLSSSTEACPLVAGESMACGVPFVGTDVGDVKEIVGASGIVVPPRSPKELARAWLQIATMTSEQRRQLGESARQRIVDHYSVSAWRKAYANLYDGLVFGNAVHIAVES